MYMHVLTHKHKYILCVVRKNLPQSPGWYVCHVVHLWCEWPVRVKPAKLKEVILYHDLDVACQSFTRDWCKHIVYDRRELEEISPVLITLRYQISHQQRQITCQAPALCSCK